MPCRCTISLYTRPRSHNFMKDTTSHVKKNNNCKDSNKCKEKGCHHVIGIGKKGRNRQCHIHPYNASSSSGHGEVRRHNEVKEPTIQVLRRKNDGVKTISKLNFVKIFQGVLLI